jgi:hypothetical protein
MRLDRVRTLLLLSFFVLSTPVIAASSYDGLWNVTVITKTGNCQPSLHYPLTVNNGTFEGTADVSGRVNRDGSVKVSIKGVYANGTLNGSSGSGKWNGASGGIACSGYWVASRQ